MISHENYLSSITGIERLEAVRNIGKTAVFLEQKANDLRSSIAQMCIDSVETPANCYYSISNPKLCEHLNIQAIGRKAVTNDETYLPTGEKYKEVVKIDNLSCHSIEVDLIEVDYHTFDIWGINYLKQVRVLIENHFKVNLVEVSDDSPDNDKTN